LGAAYTLSYGGGLVSGDDIALECCVGNDRTLVLLTQGNTKIFKPSDATSRQRQMLEIEVEAKASIILLPAPVTCFAQASYQQFQTIRLANDTSSVILLDWLTSGRTSRGEAWEFANYRSENSIRLGPKLIAQDVLWLKNDPIMGSIRSRVEPYQCYATLLLFGPIARTIIDRFEIEWDDIRQISLARKPNQEPKDILWSFSSLLGGKGAIVRCAGLEIETVRTWLKYRLKSLDEVLGRDLYRNAWA